MIRMRRGLRALGSSMDGVPHRRISAINHWRVKVGSVIDDGSGQGFYVPRVFRGVGAVRFEIPPIRNIKAPEAMPFNQPNFPAR